VGSSVERHHHIRKLREFYRLNKPLFPETVHLFLLVRRPVKDWKAVEGKLAELLARIMTDEARIPPLPPADKEAEKPKS
jgi:hypothetical protein